MLLRFAGPRLANDPDDLTPVRLRRNGRVLGGAMSWDTPKRLADFDEASPFFGLAVPADVDGDHGRFSPSPTPASPPRPGRGSPTARRSSTVERRGKGVDRAVPCRRRRELVEPADLRAFRRNAQTHLRAVERRRGRAVARAPRDGRPRDAARPCARSTVSACSAPRRPTAKAIGGGFRRTWRRRASARILRRAGRRDRGATLAPDDSLRRVRFRRVRAFAAAVGAPGRRARFAAAAVDADFCRAARSIGWPCCGSPAGCGSPPAPRRAWPSFASLGVSINAHPARADAQQSGAQRA